MQINNHRTTYVDQLCGLYRLGENPTKWDYARVAGIVLLTCTVALPILAFLGAFIVDCCIPPCTKIESISSKVELSNKISQHSSCKQQVSYSCQAILHHVCNDPQDYHPTKSVLIRKLQLSEEYFTCDADIHDAVTTQWPPEEFPPVVDEEAISKWLAKKGFNLDKLQRLGMIQPKAFQHCLTTLSIIMHLDEGHPKEVISFYDIFLLRESEEE